jgi:hypothetical protein
MKLLALALLALCARGQYMPGASGRRQRDKEPIFVKGDLAPIACDVCEMAIESVFQAVEAKRADAPMTTAAKRPGGKKERRSSLSEADVNEALGEVCHRKKKGGEWLWHTDLVELDASAPKALPAALSERGARLHRPLTSAEKKRGARHLLVASHEGIGKWDRETATVAKSCVKLFDSMDVDELSVALWRGGAELAELTQLACAELTSRCKGGPRPALKAEREDFVFDEQDRQLMETEQMMQNMEDQGLPPMVMQSREDIEEELREMAEDMDMSPEEMEAMMSGGGAADELDDGGFAGEAGAGEL